MYDVQNIIVDNVLTKSQIDFVYDSIKNPTNKFFFEFYGQSISDFILSDDIYNRIVTLAEQASGYDHLEIMEYQFARYSPIDSNNLPNLSPHFDTFPEPRLTFDYQVGSNTTWPLVVENKEYELKNNQALTFSGTHQIHWRTHKEFKENDYVDMIFFHLRQKGAEPTTPEHTDKMQKMKDKHSEIWYNSNNMKEKQK